MVFLLIELNVPNSEKEEERKEAVCNCKRPAIQQLKLSLPYFITPQIHTYTPLTQP